MFFQIREGSHKGRYTLQTSNIAMNQSTLSISWIKSPELKQGGWSILFAEIERIVTEKLQCGLITITMTNAEGQGSSWDAHDKVDI